MGLSEKERQILEQMEKEFRLEDPQLASTLSIKNSQTERHTVVKISPRRLAVGLTLAVLGLILPIVGISIGGTFPIVAFGVTGFALMVFGVLHALRSPR